MEKTTNFLIDPIFNDPSLLKDFISRISEPRDSKSFCNCIFSESSDNKLFRGPFIAHTNENQWYVLTIGPDGMDRELVGTDQTDQLGTEIACVYSHWSLMMYAHQWFVLKIETENLKRE